MFVRPHLLEALRSQSVASEVTEYCQSRSALRTTPTGRCHVQSINDPGTRREPQVALSVRLHYLHG